jgi:hypothetical protein
MGATLRGREILMLTRFGFSHTSDPQVPPPVNTPGAMVDRPVGAFNTRKPNIVARMPIARPNSSPSPDGAPFYLGSAYQPNKGVLIHGGSMPLTPSRPVLEMDPSDPTTWQRDYRFT